MCCDYADRFRYGSCSSERSCSLLEGLQELLNAQSFDCVCLHQRLSVFMWKSVERRYMLMMVMCWLVIYGSQPHNQEITEFVRMRDAAGIHLV